MKPEHIQALKLDDAIARGAVEEVRALLDGGVDPNLRDVVGDTPLINAAWMGAPQIVALLLQRGANANVQGADGRNALQRLATNDIYWYFGHDECVQLLRAAGANP